MHKRTLRRIPERSQYNDILCMTKSYNTNHDWCESILAPAAYDIFSPVLLRPVPSRSVLLCPALSRCHSSSLSLYPGCLLTA